MNSKYLTPVLVVALIGTVGATAFFAGTRFVDRSDDFEIETVKPRMYNRTMHGRAMVNGMMNRSGASGEIAAIEGNTITVKRPNGLTEKIILTGDTDITRTSTATVNDLSVGNQVMVFGQENNEELTADAIEINPLTRKWMWE